MNSKIQRFDESSLEAAVKLVAVKLAGPSVKKREPTDSLATMTGDGTVEIDLLGATALQQPKNPANNALTRI